MRALETDGDKKSEYRATSVMMSPDELIVDSL